MGARYRPLLLLAASLAALVAAPAARGDTYLNLTPMSIPGAFVGAATPYPTSIEVSGVAGTVAKANVQLIDVDIGGNREELDLVLSGPGGSAVRLWSDACGVDAMNTGLDYLFDDAAVPLPDAGPCAQGTYRPTDYLDLPGDDFTPGGGPAGPFATELAAFNGISPNGTWSLFARSDENGDFLVINAWALTLAIQPPPPVPTATTPAAALAAPTGQAAAALRRCKRKHGKARRKCKKKAGALPA